MNTLLATEFEAIVMLAKVGVKLLRVCDDFYCRWTRYMANAICESYDNIGHISNIEHYYTKQAPDELILRERRGNSYFYRGLSVRRDCD